MAKVRDYSVQTVENSTLEHSNTTRLSLEPLYGWRTSEESKPQIGSNKGIYQCWRRRQLKKKNLQGLGNSVPVFDTKLQSRVCTSIPVRGHLSLATQAHMMYVK